MKNKTWFVTSLFVLSGLIVFLVLWMNQIGRVFEEKKLSDNKEETVLLDDIDRRQLDSEKGSLSELYQNHEKFSYCKPDRYEEIFLDKDDGVFYHYTGNKKVKGKVSLLEGKVIFSPITTSAQQCSYILVKDFEGYDGNNEKELDDFHMNALVQSNKTECSDPNSKPVLEGVYVVSINRLVLPKSYIEEEYDPNVYGTSWQMIRYPFYFEYADIVSVESQSAWSCPMVVY